MNDFDLNKKVCTIEHMWKDVKNTNYQVSDKGEVKNAKTGKILKQCNHSKNGYIIVCLCVNGMKHNVFVHRLVAKAFIPNPDNLPEVNHKDEDTTNNQVSNLEWCDRNYNINYGKRNNKVADKLSRVIIERDIYTNETKTWKGLQEAAENNGVTPSCMWYRIKHNVIIGGIEWRYAC